MKDLIFPNEMSEPFDAALQRSAVLAERLARESGLGPGERLVLALENSRAHVDLVLASWRLGVQLVAVPPTASGPTFAGILDSVAPRVVAVESKNERLARIVDDWARTIQGLEGTPAGGGIVLGLAGAAAQGTRAARPDALAAAWQEWLAHLPPAVFYTSGSTSTAKGVPLHWTRILAKGRAVLGHYGVTAQDRVMPILPLSHVYGLYCLLGAIDLGADAILCSESGTPAALAGGLAEHGASVAVCPPIVGAFLFGRHGCAPAIRERLRVLSMGGAATSPEQAQRILQALPNTRVFLSYGLAETYSTICCNEASLPGADPRSVGRLAFGAFGEARDPASGRAVAPGEIGELCVGGSIMQGYVGDHGDAFTADGLFRTGDLVRLAPDGAITITGRLKEMINAGGLSIYPAEIEEALKRHPAVADCGVFGERAGDLEVACAAVALREAAAAREPQALLDELLDHCRAHLATKMVPRRLVIVPGIPRGALGKIARAELRKLCAPATART